MCVGCVFLSVNLVCGNGRVVKEKFTSVELEKYSSVVVEDFTSVVVEKFYVCCNGNFTSAEVLLPGENCKALHTTLTHFLSHKIYLYQLDGLRYLTEKKSFFLLSKYLSYVLESFLSIVLSVHHVLTIVPMPTNVGNITPRGNAKIPQF